MNLTHSMKTSLQLAKSASFLALIGALAVGGLTSGCAPKATPETTGQYVDDAVVTTKVKSALLGDDAVKSFEIKVETHQGVVQLSGFVDTSAQKSAAGKDASGVPNVKDVKNDLIVK
jgi:osmotically-inducible protein OsmY